MTLSLLNGHGTFLFRYLHVFFGIIWIGLLYYFNFVQTPFFAETDNATKSGAIQKLVPRALWWFRWGAMFTFLTGLCLLLLGVEQNGMAALGTQWGTIILPGATFGTLMFLNVWLIIWPNQKIVIASTTAVATGGQANPAAAAAGARAGVASRTNTLFSIPMLFCMIGTGHLIPSKPLGETANYWAYGLILGIIALVIEFNAIKGKLVGPLKTVRGVITAGFGLSILVYACIELFL